MKYLPGILLNPNKFDFFIDEYEIDFLRDTKNNLIKKYYNLAFKSLWNATLYNLHKRIEIFGTYEFINNLKGDDRYIYFSEFDTLSEKLNQLNPLVKIRNAYEVEIINSKTLNILNFFLALLKSNTSEPLSYEDVTSIAILLEKNLFKLRLNYKAINKENFLLYEKNEPLKNEVNSFDSSQNYIPKRRKSDYSNTNFTKKYKKQELMMLQQLTPNYPKRRKDDNINEEFIPRRRKSDWINESYNPKRRKDDF